MAIDFVTFAAGNYAHWLRLWLSSAARYNPGARLFIYDVSPTPSEAIAALAKAYPNCTVVPWPEDTWKSPAWIDTLDFRFFWPGFGLRDELKYQSRRLRHAVTRKKKHDWMIDKKKFVADKKFFIRICCQKPYILSDAWRRSDRPLAYVDADAVVLERFDAYPGGTSDFTVTVVDRDQVRIGGEWEPMGPDGPLPVVLINAGVMFANRTDGAQRLIATWIAEMDRVRHGGADQIALANLLQRNGQRFHESSEPLAVATEEGSAIVAGLPCARFNQVRIPRDGRSIDPSTSIVHFVGSWKQPEHWPSVEKLIAGTWSHRPVGGESKS
jgi:hypothetical protein